LETLHLVLESSDLFESSVTAQLGIIYRHVMVALFLDFTGSLPGIRVAHKLALRSPLFCEPTIHRLALHSSSARRFSIRLIPSSERRSPTGPVVSCHHGRWNGSFWNTPTLLRGQPQSSQFHSCIASETL